MIRRCPQGKKRQRAKLGRIAMVAHLAAAPGQQTRGTVLFEPVQQAEDPSPSQAEQRVGIRDTQTTGLDPHSFIATAEDARRAPRGWQRAEVAGASEVPSRGKAR
jgi:hypothetical protein